MKQPILGAIRITRPLNCMTVFAGTLLGGHLSHQLGSPNLWLAATVAALITASGNAFNDCFDLEIDRINKPSRPLPAGQLSRSAARCWATALIATALSMALLLGWMMALFATVMAVLAYVYSWKLKRTFLVGNALVSMMSALTIVYGGLATDQVAPALVPAFVVLVFMLCREILKTIEDYEGDRLAQARTIAVAWGKTGALRAFALLAVCGVFFTLLPWLGGSVSAIYPLLVVPLVDGVLLAGTLVLLKWPDRRHIKVVLLVTKIDWLVWLVAMFGGLRSAM